MILTTFAICYKIIYEVIKMAKIKAFNGYLYNQDKIDNLGKVTSLPYDSITAKEQQELYEMHEYNAVRLVKGLQYDTDTPEDNQYTRAGKFLNDWIEKDILVKDKSPAIYLYEQKVVFNKTTFKNTGFVALLELDDKYKNVIPCEDTTPSSNRASYEILSHTKANLNMISCMYIESDKGLSRLINEVSESSPQAEFVLSDGTKERIWKITDQTKIDFITKELSHHTVYISDGQNRYESSLQYQKECIANNPDHTGDEPYNYIMTLLTNAYDDGMVMVPFHRLVKFKKEFNESFFIAACQDNFKVEKIIVDTDTSEFVDTIKKQIGTTRHENKIALYCGGSYFYRLTIKNRDALKQYLPDKCDGYYNLDVAVLNNLILSDVLNITDDNYNERIDYTKSVTEGVQKVKSGEYGCLLAINPVKAEQVREVALAGEKLPPMSICVFPKPVTGTIINKLD